MKKVIYYSDEQNDDFSPLTINAREVPENFSYISKNVVFKAVSWFLYNIICRPIAKLYLNFVFLCKFKNRKVLKQVKKQGYFLYINHTQTAADAFLPTCVMNRKENYIVVSPATISIPGIKNLVKMLGAVPLASTYKKQKEMINCLDSVIRKKNVVTIYPEAHIWPYYTKIREFSEGSFIYPVKFNAPVFAVTNCYKKRLIGKKPRIVSYVDGPFYPSKDLSRKEAMIELKDKVYNAMVERSEKESNYEYITYIKNEKKGE